MQSKVFPMFAFQKRVVVAATFAAFGVTAYGQSQVYVSPSGNDAWSGKLSAANAKKTDGPKRTLGAAQTLVRTMTANGVPTGGIVVNIAAGTYDLTNQLYMTSRDSGTASAPIIWRGAGSGTTLLSGGTALTSWKKAPTTGTRLNPTYVGKILVADLSALKVAKLASWARKGFPYVTQNYHAELFYNGARQTLAQYPNAGWLKPAANNAAGTSVTVNEVKTKKWNTIGDIRAYGYFGYNWADSYENVSSMTTAGVVNFAANSYYGVSTIGRLKFVNVMEELDTPGEYYIDYATQKIYYYPVDATMSKRVALSNNRSTIIGLFQTNNVRFEKLGVVEGAMRGVYVDRSDNVTFEGCAFKCLNQAGIYANKPTNFNVLGCDFSDLGEGGIYLNSGDRPTLTSGGSSVKNCFFTNYGQVCRTYKPGIEVAGVGNLISNNRFTNAPHQAIWIHGNNNIIEKNEISKVCLDTDDASAIYMGRNMSEYGNVIRYNVIQDLKQNTGGLNSDRVVGIYLDDLASGTQVYGNVMHRVDLGMMIGGGRDNTVTDNVFDTAKDAVEMDARGTSWASSMVANNNFTSYYTDINPAAAAWYNAYPQVYNLPSDNPGVPKRNVVDRNVAVGTSFGIFADGMSLTAGGANFSGANNYTGFVTNFISLATNDVRPLPGSPAAQIGFQAGQTTSAGLTNTNGRSGVSPLQ